MKLPPMPDAKYTTDYHSEKNAVLAWTEEQVKAYGLACAEAMREECAKVCNQMADWADGAGNSQRDEACCDCASAIRSIEVER